MGSGKTYYAVFYTIELLKKHKFNSIKTNIHSLKIKDQLIEYFDTIDELYNDFEDNCLYIIDELGKNILVKVDKIIIFMVGYNNLENVIVIVY